MTESLIQPKTLDKHGPMTCENVKGWILEAANNALIEMREKHQINPFVMLTGRDGKTVILNHQIANAREEKDFTLFVWFKAIECDAQALLSVTNVYGRKETDGNNINRQYLVVSACIKVEGKNKYWASMTELLPNWRNTGFTPAIGEPQTVDESIGQATGDGPSLYSFSNAAPTNAERAEARKRVETALKRYKKGKPMFIDAIHQRIGW